VDNLRSYGSTNYQVQKLYSANKDTDIVHGVSRNKPLSGQDSLYASAVIDKNTNEVIIKIVNSSANEKATCLAFEGVKKITSQATVTVLTGESLEKMNSLDVPLAISPVTHQMTVKGKKIDLSLKPNSLTVVRVAMK